MLHLKTIIRDYAPFITKQGKVNIKIRFRHNKEYIYLPTEYYVEPEQFNKETGLLNDRHSNWHGWNLQLKYLLLGIEEKLLSLGSRRGYMTKEAIISYLKKDQPGELDFQKYLEEHIETLKKTRRERSAVLYNSTLNHLKKFRRGILDFRDINAPLLYRFENFLRLKNLKVNTIANIMSHIRVIYNKAINEELIGLESYPFRRFKIKKETTIKRNLSIVEIRKIKEAYLSPKFTAYRDIFLLIFYLMGINIIDLLYLKEINDGRITYRRSKTNRIYSVRVYPEAMEIINKYPGENYLLRFIEDTGYDLFRSKINRYLRKIAQSCGISHPVSSYYARHSWATIASGLDVPRDVIAHALGHGQSTVTDIYIDFDMEKVDIANRKVIDAIKSYSG